MGIICATFGIAGFLTAQEIQDHRERNRQKKLKEKQQKEEMALKKFADEIAASLYIKFKEGE